MEARQTLRGSAVPKSLMVALAICAAVALAAIGTVVTKDFASGGAAAVKSTVHAAPGTVLRQDDPVQGAGLIVRAAESAAGAPAGSHTGRSSGNLSVIQDSDTTGLTSGYNPGWEVRPVREGRYV